MLFSFLVPVYNTEKYLRQCIDSLLAQTGADFEIILLDDGSTDSSPEICDAYAAGHPDIVKVVHKNNEGSLLTRRRGFHEAMGDWLICIDSDDYVTTDLLVSILDVINGNSDCDMVMFNHYYVDNQGIITPSRLKFQDGAVFYGKSKQTLYKERLTTTKVNSMCLRAVHKSIIDMHTDYSQLGIKNMCDDALQVLPLYTNAQKIVYIEKPLYFYRKGDISTTSRITFAQWQAIHRSFVLEEPYAELWNVPVTVSCERYTKQMENICNCVRWVYRNENSMELSLAETIRTMKTESLFGECLAHYDRKYASSHYSAISMPIIAAAVDREWFRFLKCYFRLENWLRKR